MNKQEQIEEMAKYCCNPCEMSWGCEEGDCTDKGANGYKTCQLAKGTAEFIYNAGYRKIPEGAVVLTKEEIDLWKDGESKKLAYHNHIVEQEKQLTKANTLYRFSKRFMQLLNDEVLDYRNDLFVEIQGIVNKVTKEIMEGERNEKPTNQNQSTID